MIFFTVLKGRPSVHEILIAVFVTLTTPVTLMMLARATLYRDRVEGGSASPKSPAAGAASNRAGEGQPDNITGAREI